MFRIFTFVFCFLLTGLVLSQSNEELNEGMSAPDFELSDQHGDIYRLSDYENRNPVVIFFYPKAGTSGCTKQACGMRDEISKFKEKNIKVFGISTDPVEDIQKFVEDHNLNFSLLSDDSKRVTPRYGVLRDNGMAKRVTFIVNNKGIIHKIIPVTDIDSHAAEVYSIASQLVD